MSDYIFFLHIPKTGGTTLNLILRYQFGKNYFRIFPPQHCNDKKGYFNAEVRKIDLDAILREPVATKLISGHYEFGVHSQVTGGFSYISLVRSPASFIQSYFYYIKRNYVQKLTNIEEYLQKDWDLIHRNEQSRRIAGIYHDNGNNMSDTEILKRAVFNIENYFKFVGVLERFDESLACMSRLIGFGKNLFYIKRNAFSDRGYVLSDKYMKIISERNRADEQLYKYVNARLDALRTAETERIMQTIHRNNIITMPLRIIYPLRNYFLSIGQARTFLSKCSAVLCLRHRAR